MSQDSLAPRDQVWDDVAPPRPLTSDEEALLTALVDVVDSAELGEQVRTTQVTGICRCGCSSLRLSTVSRALPEEATLGLTCERRDDYFGLSGVAKCAGAGTVRVTAHVIRGRLAELEIYAGTGNAVTPAQLSKITDIETVA